MIYYKQETTNCPCCNVQFTPVSFSNPRKTKIKYCSSKCRSLFSYRNINGHPKIENKICKYCKKEFVNDKYHPNKESCSEQCSNKLSYEKNKSKRIKYNTEWQKNNKDLVRLYHRTHYKNNLEKVRIRKRARNTGKISYKQWEQICKSTFNLCVQCFEKFDIKDLTIDHIIPISLGGTNDVDNLQPLCFDCNRLKGNRWIGTIPREIYLNMRMK